MGYDTYFDGQLFLDKLLTAEQGDAIARDKQLQGDWAVFESRNEIEPESGRHYDYEDKLAHLLHHLHRWGITANGYIEWSGEEWDDHGVMRVIDGELSVGHLRLEFDFGDGEVVNANAINAAKSLLWAAHRKEATVT